MVDIEQFPPVLSVVGPVGLSVELAGQEVEQFLRLPAQQGQPVLKYGQKVIIISSSSSSSSSSLEHHGPFGITIPEDVQSYKVARYFVRAAREKTIPSSSSASTGSTSSGLSEEIERRSALSVLARAPSRLEKLCWEPTGFFTTLMSLVELTCGGGGGCGGGGKGAWSPVCAPDEAREA